MTTSEPFLSTPHWFSHSSLFSSSQLGQRKSLRKVKLKGIGLYTAGFIGSHFTHFSKAHFKKGSQLIALDLLTYAGHKINLSPLIENEQIKFIEGDICDSDRVDQILQEHEVTSIVNFAAESHVDRSIDSPSNFIQTNVVGTYNLLLSSLNYWKSLNEDSKKSFRFVQVSTDEVYGSLNDEDPPFEFNSPIDPSSPYSASKAAADHLVLAWNRTYGLPTLITRCTNNYGPRQYPEKLIPVVIRKAIQEQPIPVYGNGRNIRDWIHVEDHCQGIALALEKGVPGEVYAMGGDCEIRNIDIVQKICQTLDRIQPRKEGKKYKALIEYVTDRLGHDWRYALSNKKSSQELGYSPKHNIDEGLEQTIQWYLENPNWSEEVLKK